MARTLKYCAILFVLLVCSVEAEVYSRLTWRNDQWYGSSYWGGPDWTRVGRNWHHPGADTPSIRCFTVPEDGRIRISGRAYKADTNNGGGDGVRLSISLNEKDLWVKEIDGSDSKGVEADLVLDVKKGEAIRFAVHKRGRIFFDTTYWDPLIKYEGRPGSFQASEGFDAKKQGGDGWSYEMVGKANLNKDDISTPDVGLLLKDLPAGAGPENDLWSMICADWYRQDWIDGSAEGFIAAGGKHARAAGVILGESPGSAAKKIAAGLSGVARTIKKKGLSVVEARGLYVRARWLKRMAILDQPLMNTGPLLFCKRVPTSYSHLVMQYYGWRARPGGGLFVLESPGESMACRDILEGKLSGGSVLEPRLSYDGKRIVFSYVADAGTNYNPAELRNDKDYGFYHVYVVNVDGTGLTQLTKGPYDDIMPTFLPGGGIVFCSTRRRGYARCFGGQFSQRWHVYTLHRMDDNGRNLKTISFHDTNEWFPAVSNSGHVLYARWDYIDRDAVTHQNLWATRPDGSNPVAVWGNATPKPHCTFQPKPIPGSNKIVFIASAHHSITAGPVAIVDPSIANNGQEAITRITPEIKYPEAEVRLTPEYYTSPWPLSEKLFIVAFSNTRLLWEPHANEPNALGLYVLDAAGNREILYRDPEIGSTSPCPLRPRPEPPVITSYLPESAGRTGNVTMQDVYQGLEGIPRGTVKELRIVQIFPKSTPLANRPAIGLAGEENARAILGTVPVESDGSAHFTVPACKPILFQALDADGMAVQTMRSLTYLQPGESVSCIGCHEKSMTTPVVRKTQALQRPPSEIDPGALGGRPFSFMEVVQPVLDKHCVKCHSGAKPKKGKDLTGTPFKGYSKSYWALCGDRNFSGEGTNPKNAAEALVPRFGMRNRIEITPPGGMYGSRGSRLIKHLRKGHSKVKLSSDDLYQLAAWIDMNAIFYGVYEAEGQARQFRGEPVQMPELQ